MGLRYSDFVVPLVKAVQELSKQNDELKKENDELQKRVSMLEAVMSSQRPVNTQQDKISSPIGGVEGASLEQNMPNPFKQTTAIRYFIPARCKKCTINDYR